MPIELGEGGIMVGQREKGKRGSDGSKTKKEGQKW
jgi:hypothetical protein